MYKGKSRNIMDKTNKSGSPMTLNIHASKDDAEYLKNCDLFLLKNVFKSNESVRMLAKEVESLSFDYSVNDLHSLFQSGDLVTLTDTLPPLVSQLVSLMLSHVRTIIEDLFNVKTKQNITITASKYNKGDYLLCHDDLCEDRHIAFVYYLSENWEEAYGGALRFFNLHEDTKEPLNDNQYRQVLVPMFNSLVAFRVSDSSYHEVQQVFSEKTRLSINGWFHCNTVNGFAVDKKQTSIFLKAPLSQFDKYYPAVDLAGIVQPVYRSLRTLEVMSQTLQLKTGLMAESFLKDSLYDSCLSELQGDVPWIMKGPANHRKYEVLEVEVIENKIQLPENLPSLKQLLEALVSPYWLHYLNRLTNLEFAIFSEQNVPPTCMIEIQRWKEGSYSLLADNDFQKKFPTLDVTFFFGVNNEILGDGRSPTEDSADLSGHIVHSVMKNHSSSYFRALARIKGRRLEDELSDYNVKLKSRSPKFKNGRTSHSKSPMIMNRMSKSHLAIKLLVNCKIGKIKQYRRRKVEIEENNILTPMSNAMLLTMNCDSAVKFTSFIKHSENSLEPRPCYYSVTVSYLTSCAYHERASGAVRFEGDFIR